MMGVALMSGNHIRYRLLMKVDETHTFDQVYKDFLNKITVVLEEGKAEGEPQVYVGADSNYDIQKFDNVDWTMAVKDVKELNDDYKYVIIKYEWKRKVDLTMKDDSKLGKKYIFLIS